MLKTIALLAATVTAASASDSMLRGNSQLLATPETGHQCDAICEPFVDADGNDCDMPDMDEHFIEECDHHDELCDACHDEAEAAACDMPDMDDASKKKCRAAAAAADDLIGTF